MKTTAYPNLLVVHQIMANMVEQVFADHYGQGELPPCVIPALIQLYRINYLEEGPRWGAMLKIAMEEAPPKEVAQFESHVPRDIVDFGKTIPVPKKLIIDDSDEGTLASSKVTANAFIDRFVETKRTQYISSPSKVAEYQSKLEAARNYLQYGPSSSKTEIIKDEAAVRGIPAKELALTIVDNNERTAKVLAAIGNIRIKYRTLISAAGSIPELKTIVDSFRVDLEQLE